MLGLPFAFASQFAPGLLFQAIETYRARFEASAYLERPYVIAGVPIVAAETDAEAMCLSTSPLQRFLKLIRNEPIFTPPPVASMDGLWNAAEQHVVESKFAIAIVGGPETVRRKLTQFLDETQADEVIFTSDVYEHSKRLRSFEIAASAMQ